MKVWGHRLSIYYGANDRVKEEKSRADNGKLWFLTIILKLEGGKSMVQLKDLPLL